ncbi:hypothetical protein BH23CHL2_BH23CHL2_24160 [soil metagenome]
MSTDHQADHHSDQETDQPVGYTIRQASDLLGISENAVRQRIKRGTIEAEKIGGRWRINLDDHQSITRPTTSTDHQSTTTPTTSTDRQSTTTPTNTSTTSDQTELVEVLREEIEFLRDQLDQRTQAERELRLIIARLAERIPELPSSTTQSTATPTSDTQDESPDDDRRDDPGSSSRPWWRFWRG